MALCYCYTAVKASAPGGLHAGLCHAFLVNSFIRVYLSVKSDVLIRSFWATVSRELLYKGSIEVNE